MPNPKLLSPLSTTAHLLLPTRLNEVELNFLLEQFQGTKPVLLTDNNDTLKPAYKSLVEQEGLELHILSDGAWDDSALAEGLAQKVVIYLPPETVTSKGGPVNIPSEYMERLCKLGLPIRPLAVHRPAEIRLRTDDLSADPCVIMCPGEMIPAQSASVSEFLNQALISSEKAFSSRAFLKGSFAATVFRSLYHHGKENTVFDGSDNGELTYHRMLCASLALSDHILQQTEKERVGIILPPGKGGLIANLAVLFCGKVPVNLNFTASKQAVQSCMEQGDLDFYISATPVLEKIPSFPWPADEQLLLIDHLVKKLKPKALKYMMVTKFTSAESIIKSRGLDQRRDHDEAVLLFTSGSSGLPKGVPLSCRNLLANVCQFSTRIKCPPETKLLGCLPLFHSFGCTVTTFFPLIQGYDLVTYPSPLETKKLGELIEEKEVTLLTATPTFLRGYLKRVKPEQLESVQYVVTGAEKLSRSVAGSFKDRFQHTPHEGYGLTETSPAAFLNVPDLPPESGKELISTEKAGTVGMPLVGVAVRMTDATTGEDIPLGESGCVWLKGANIFQGYLNRPDVTEEVFQDGWFNTGDIGSVDESGFLTIEGRLSRFSKIGGEMVPHENVEQEIDKALGLTGEEVRRTAIVGIPDEKKGEAMVLLTSMTDKDPEELLMELRQKLLAAEVPSLWLPKMVLPVSEIPILGSGKLDLGNCKKLVEQLVLN